MRLCFTSSPSSCARIWCLTVPCSAAVADTSLPAALLALLVFALVLSCRRFTPMHALASLVLAVLLPLAFAAMRALGLDETTLASYDGCALPQHEPGSLLGVVHSHVRNRVALLAGTGPSAGAVDTGAAEWLEENMDVWALNQFFLHPALTPRFYNLEMRSLGDASNDEYWRRFFVGQKRLRYEQTLFLARSQHAPAVRRVLCAATPVPKMLATYHVTVLNAGFALGALSCTAIWDWLSLRRRCPPHANPCRRSQRLLRCQRRPCRHTSRGADHTTLRGADRNMLDAAPCAARRGPHRSQPHA